MRVVATGGSGGSCSSLVARIQEGGLSGFPVASELRKGRGGGGSEV